MQNLIKFNRQENMDAKTRESILGLIVDLKRVDIEDGFLLTNQLYGLFDGYYYQASLSDFKRVLDKIDTDKSERLETILKTVETYPMS
jgi:hypothetical protein